jgi:hypothetical protein
VKLHQIFHQGQAEAGPAKGGVLLTALECLEDFFMFPLGQADSRIGDGDIQFLAVTPTSPAARPAVGNRAASAAQTTQATKTVKTLETMDAVTGTGKELQAEPSAPSAFPQ